MSSQEIWKAQAYYGRQKTDPLNDYMVFHRFLPKGFLSVPGIGSLFERWNLEVC